jgi:CheY-like chemotaxis protein
MTRPLALVAEDDEDLAAIFMQALDEVGFETELVWAGDTALARLAEVVPNLIVLDLHLPHVLGTEILAQIHADPRLANTRVIVATADARMAEVLHNQADMVLVKPVSYNQLRDFARCLL